MKNKLIKLSVLAIVAVAVVSGTGSVLAQNPPSTSPSAVTPPCCKTEVGVGTAVAVPAGYTVVPPNDNDRADDQIVQIENLTIRSMSNSVPGTIYASRDIGGPCREYMDVNGTGSKAYPCPAAPSFLYQISVQPDTILLLKNRSRASISDFAVGDRINVFGFADPGTSGVQALIVRDLDQPSGGANGRYVQLSNLTVISGPDSSTVPAYIRAARKGVEPCLSFTTAAPRGVSIPCPMGVDVSTSAEALTATSAELYRPFSQYYGIRVGASTQLLNANRQRISLSAIQPGDSINVYGLYAPASRSVEAIILRDLSVPRSNNGTASLVVNVTNKDIVCIKAPCGQVEGAKVDVHWLDYDGDDTPTLVDSEVTVNGQASFRNLKPGRYIVTVSGSGFSSIGRQVVLVAGQTGKIDLVVSRDGETPTIEFVYPQGGETFQIGSTLSIRWQPDPRISNAADIFLQGEWCNSQSKDIACPAVMPNQYTIARGVGQPNPDGTMSYAWQVPNVLEKILLGPGLYRIKVCYAGTSNCAWNGSAFKIADKDTKAPSISSISPASGSEGTTITLRGKFAASNNAIYFGSYFLTTADSKDGTTLSFSMPGFVSPCPSDPYNPRKTDMACIMIAMRLPGGAQPIYVRNDNGTSNSVTFNFIPTYDTVEKQAAF